MSDMYILYLALYTIEIIDFTNWM